MEFLQAGGQSECHLVLSATTKSVGHAPDGGLYEGCKPDYLAFTKIDETTTFGPLLNELVRTKKGVSYYSDGQRIPDDLHLAAREQIVRTGPER